MLVREIGSHLHDSLLFVGMMEEFVHLVLPLLIILEKSIECGENAPGDGKVDAESYLRTGNLGRQAKKNGERRNEENAGDGAEDETNGIANDLANEHRTSEERGERHGNDEDGDGKYRVTDETGMEAEAVPLLLLSDPLPPDPRREKTEYAQDQSNVQHLLLQLQAAKNTGEFFEHRDHYTDSVTFRPLEVIESVCEKAV